jgi:hypothetical protein
LTIYICTGGSGRTVKGWTSIGSETHQVKSFRCI